MEYALSEVVLSGVEGYERSGNVYVVGLFYFQQISVQFTRYWVFYQ